MGSAQSARRIQPGGARPAVPVVPADLSRSPFLPTPSPARRSPLPASRRRRLRSLRGVGGRSGGGRGVWWGRAGGAGGGAGGGPSPGRRPAAAGRTSTEAVRRDRLRDGWEGPAGKVARGGRRHPWRRTTPPRVLQPPGSSVRRIPGPREPDTRRRALPPLPPGQTGAGGGRAAPPTARPLSHPSSPLSLSGEGARGAGRTVPSAPRASSRRRARGAVGHASPPPGGTKPSARGRRRCRLPTRPVLKHGPRSLTRARVRGSSESRRGAMKVKGPVRGPEVGSRGLSSPPRAHHRPVSPAPPGRWSTSVRVRTRKMVNYAWAGRSQRKLWWRSVAVLTCKSVVRPGYRGERLIEPSSSWFPPKFPSG